jgi:S-adenosylmethionine:tRNA ribosyltransferase-isomerase
MLELNDFDYYLPKNLIAQFPVKPRSSSRLLVLNRKKRTLEHKHFYDLPDYVNDLDCVVLNDTRVFPVRLIGINKRNNKKIEILLLSVTSSRDEKELKSFTYLENPSVRRVFECLAKPAKYLQEKDKIFFGNKELEAEVLSKGKFVKLKLFLNNNNLKEIIQKIGQVPLPPYIKRRPVYEDQESYQTVYAKQEGAVAAPTAGLHFTKDLLEELKAKGIDIAYLTLHTSYGTFAPVRIQNLRRHKMYEEYFSISKECVCLVNKAKKNKGRIFSVGTTTCRALETAAINSKIKEVRGKTNLFIYPPYEFKVVDALITNFHLPKTTLLMLVAAFCQGDMLEPRAGLEFLMKAYQEAIKEKYRFYSYGDAMLII